MILMRLTNQMANGWGLFMKDSLKKILWGVILVVFGVALAGRVLGLFDFNLFFPGWWTLFIIIPSAVGLISGNNISSNIGGIAIGFMLLLTQTGGLNWQQFGKLLIAVLLVTLGLSFLFPDSKHKYRKENKKSKEYTNSKYQDNQYKSENNDKSYDKEFKEYHKDNFGTKNEQTDQSYNSETEYMDVNTAPGFEDENHIGATNSFHHDTVRNIDRNTDRNSEKNSFRQYTGFFSVQKEQFVDEVFGGAVITAILGGVELDLRNAVFLNDTIIDITCIMGGVDIFVPTNMKVVVNCTPIMGGVECYVKNLNNQAQNQHTLFIKGNCLMGGVEIK